MAKNRIVLLIWLFAVVMLHVFGNNFGTMVILIASAAIPVLMIVLSGIAAGRMAVGLLIPDTLAYGEVLNVDVNIKGGRMLLGYVKCEILLINQFTGERHTKEMITDSANVANAGFLFDRKNCGLYSVTIIRLDAVDMFGLHSWRIKHDARSSTLVLPELFDINIEIDQSKASALDSDEYSMNHPGHDPSETFAIREYAPGDPLRSIHWKLSQKTDKLLVRELGMPIINSILLLLEVPTLNEADAGYLNSIAGILFSISHSLVFCNMPHTLGWFDALSKKHEYREITNQRELDAAFAELLANKAENCNEEYSDMLIGSVYSQIIIACPLNNSKFRLLEI